MNKNSLTIAIVCYEAVKAFLEQNQTYLSSWELSNKEDRESLLDYIEFVFKTNQSSRNSGLHDFWFNNMKEVGWKVGPLNFEEKTHPFLIPFDQLPEIERQKDALIIGIIDSFLPKNENLTFGEATDAARNGNVGIARDGWNGSGMYAYIVPGGNYLPQTEMAKKQFSGALVPYRPYWALKTAQNDIATWTPSGSDTLAMDWRIVTLGDIIPV